MTQKQKTKKTDKKNWGVDKSLCFPQCRNILKNRTKESFLSDLKEMKEKIQLFKYTDPEYHNDIREGYLQFMDDADRYLAYFEEIILDILEAMKYYEGIKDHAARLNAAAKSYERTIEKYQARLIEKGIDPIEPMSTMKQIEQELSDKAANLIRRKNKLDEAEQDIEIKQEMLAKKKSEMELALRSRYTLTDCQRQTLLEEKDKILDGIEQWGSIAGALSHNPTIKSKQSTIQMYCQLFPEFGDAIKVSKALFKDRLEAIMIDRAIEGTENPVFGKGEHIGNFKIKDNKLFLELMKAKVPEEYNKKSTEVTKNTQVNNMNIISFANVDETKEGYTKDVGVVIDVDDTGKVQRVQQEKKMLEFYAKKDGAEIIMPEESNKEE